MFIGAVLLDSQHTNNITTATHRNLKNWPTNSTKSRPLPPFSTYSLWQTYFISPTVGLEYRMPASQHLSLHSAYHLWFICTTPTSYSMKDPDYAVPFTIHTAQLAKYLQFDSQLHAHRASSQPKTLPIRFTHFSTIWNEGITPGNPHGISTIYIDANEVLADLSPHSVCTTSIFPGLKPHLFLTPVNPCLHCKLILTKSLPPLW